MYPEVSRQSAEQEINFDEERRESFQKLLEWAEDFKIVGASDTSKAIDEYFGVLLDAIPKWLISSQVFSFCRENWQTGGFSEPVIRNVVLETLRNVGLYSDTALKFLISEVAQRRDINFAENEALGFHFEDRMERGNFTDQESTLGFVKFIADSSDEQFGKRAIDLIHFYKPNLKEQVKEFFGSPVGNRLRLLGTVAWFCNDESGNQGMSDKHEDHYRIFRQALDHYRSTQEYQEYLRDSLAITYAAFEEYSRSATA